MNTNFPYGAATYGGTGGTTSHSQTLSGSLSGGSGMTVSTSDTAVASSGHSHSYSGTLDSAANNTIPPYPRHSRLRLHQTAAGSHNQLRHHSTSRLDPPYQSGCRIPTRQ